MPGETSAAGGLPAPRHEDARLSSTADAQVSTSFTLKYALEELSRVTRACAEAREVCQRHREKMAQSRRLVSEVRERMAQRGGSRRDCDRRVPDAGR